MSEGLTKLTAARERLRLAIDNMEQTGTCLRYFDDALAALTSRWTEEKPKVEGDYWHEHNGYPKRIVAVWKDLDGVLLAGVPHTGVYFRVDKVGGCWSDKPIREPEE